MQFSVQEGKAYCVHNGIGIAMVVKKGWGCKEEDMVISSWGAELKKLQRRKAFLIWIMKERWELGRNTARAFQVNGSLKAKARRLESIRNRQGRLHNSI